MRSIPTALLLVMLTMAGCLGGSGDPADADPTSSDSDGDGYTDSEEEAVGSDPDDAGSQPQVPEALHFEGTLYAAGDCAVVACGTTGQETCDMETPNCVIHTVTVDEPGWQVHFVLASTPGEVTTDPDYDLFITDADGNDVGESTNPSGEEDKVTRALSPGEYQAHVWAWNNQDAPYTLDVTFAFP